MTRRRRRMWLLLACLGGLGSATGLGLAALRRDLVFFVTPSDIEARAPGHTLRLGGLVEAGSVHRANEDGTPVAVFRVTDNRRDIVVRYAGILPALFREGQGVVALGERQPDGSFLASEVLAKHDETYMPKDLADALRRNGQWRPETGAAPPGWSVATGVPASPPAKEGRAP